MATEADTIKADKEFEIIFTGSGGHAELVPARPSTNAPGPSLPLFTVPAGLPPILPDTEEVLGKYLLHPEDLPIYDLDRHQKFIPREPCVESLYSLDVTPVQSTIVVDRNPATGELLGYKEELIPDIGTSAQNSTSLRRPPGPPDQGVKGSSANYPFWPGGLEEPDLDELTKVTSAEEIDLENDLLDVPNGYTSGMKFEKKSLAKIVGVANKPVTVLNLADLLVHTDDLDLGDGDVAEKPENESNEAEEQQVDAADNIDDIVKMSTETRVLTLPESTQPIAVQYEYAVNIDIKVPVKDFHKRIPQMAYTWPFELDTFQKQAVLHLESHDNVFVAAHTSAGKTVVAEYAIALSMKHMTRSIYTSPIKALSNQKFRDFKITFGDVGLITGDVQIHQDASCLIMTTEILRSMLYNGSDVIRDLEWVIFDEVHYINDAERGVVWEEVLIMLPQHVNIILLSATVPNTMEFADWIGRTKKKKVPTATLR